MIFKLLHQDLGGLKVYAKVDEDGVSRSSCSEENLEFQEWLAEGNTPLPADAEP